MLKPLLTLSFLLNSLIYFTQKEFTSFYFQHPLPTIDNQVQKFDSTIVGTYYFSKDSLIKMVVTPDSIYTINSLLFILSKKDLRKSKGKYYFENNKLHGIVAGEGLTYIKKEDTTYAIYNQKDLYFKPSSTHILTKQNNNYFINVKESNGYYSSTLLYPSKKELLIFSIDHEEVMPLVRSLKQLDSLQVDGIKTYIANPTVPEVNKFVEQRGFSEVIKYIKTH